MAGFKYFINMALIAGVLLLAACAVPRTADADAAIHKVVIVTAMSEDGLVNKIGLTVFSNDATSLPQEGAVSRTAVETIARRLKAARPNWQIVPADTDLVALGAKSKDGLAASDLAAILQRSGADAAFVVADAYQDTAARGAGVGAALRKLPGIDPHVVIRAHVRVEIVARNGDRLNGAMGSETPLIKASDFGVTDELSTVHAPEAGANLSRAMHDELVRDLDAALQRMGY